MTTDASYTRCDPRFRLRPGAIGLEFADPRGSGGRLSVPVVELSVSGFGFCVDAQGPELQPGSMLEQSILHAGDCTFPGDVLVRNVMQVGAEGARYGALFYPASAEVGHRFQCLLAGIEAARFDGEIPT